MLHLLAACCAFHGPSALPRLAQQRSSTVRSAAFALPVEDARTKVFISTVQVCLTNKAILSWFDRRRSRLEFVNIRDPSYSPAANGNVAFEDAMAHFHVISGGRVAEGSEAVLTAYTAVGLGWLMAVLRLPIIRWFIDGVYSVVSEHRHTISKWLPGGKALASAVTQLRDVQKASAGEGCDAEEECMLDYGDEEDEKKDGGAATAA
eukprot:jgi/Chrpa1/9852/Chrysochromulina_OHIO_Genome00015244-RA